MGSMVRMGTESRQERTDERGEVVSGMGDGKGLRVGSSGRSICTN